MKKIVIVCCALAGWLWPARAAVLLSDDFNYADGSLITNSGGVWMHHSPASSSTGQVDVVTGRVNLSQSELEDVSALLAGQPYLSSGTTNVFYAGFNVRFTSLPAATGEYIAHFKDASASGNFRARIWALTGGAASGKFRLALSSTSGSVINVTNATDLSLNTDYRIVTRLTNTSSIATLWINPSTETDANVSTSEASSAAIVATYAFRQNSGIGLLTVDDLVVATTFGEVASGVPLPTPPFITTQPQSQTVMQGATVTFTVGATGYPAPSYQWRFNSTNITYATNTTLTLTNVDFNQGGDYFVVVSNFVATSNSQTATLTVTPPVAPVAGFSLMTYNTHGNFVGDWTTNSAQVQAIGRQVQYLNPDIITFQEIPMTNSGWRHMPEFVAAYRPGFFLATNSGSDGFIRSVILSRYPIARSRAWLTNADLAPFGYTSANFTRDLFEAQISVPGFPQPVHVFTVHLKSGQGTDDSSRRTAEAGAISNYFVTGFLTTNSLHTYLLTGDMNEDIARPPSSNPQSIQKLISAPTGLHLTTPLSLSPFTDSDMTFSIQAASLTKRYDYVMPGGLLFSNIASSQVFRTDLLPSPPPPLLATDDETASDHLPVLMVFNNPYDKPFKLLSIARSNVTVTLKWESVPGQPYRVDASTNLTAWSVLASNLTATSNTHTFSTNLNDATRYFRVYRVP